MKHEDDKFFRLVIGQPWLSLLGLEPAQDDDGLNALAKLHLYFAVYTCVLSICFAAGALIGILVANTPSPNQGSISLPELVFGGKRNLGYFTTAIFSMLSIISFASTAMLIMSSHWIKKRIRRKGSLVVGCISGLVHLPLGAYVCHQTFAVLREPPVMDKYGTPGS